MFWLAAIVVDRLGLSMDRLRLLIKYGVMPSALVLSELSGGNTGFELLKGISASLPARPTSRLGTHHFINLFQCTTFNLW
jgi:hypothetical protein